jgi:hypothetical protein
MKRCLRSSIEKFVSRNGFEIVKETKTNHPKVQGHVAADIIFFTACLIVNKFTYA